MYHFPIEKALMSALVEQPASGIFPLSAAERPAVYALAQTLMLADEP